MLPKKKQQGDEGHLPFVQIYDLIGSRGIAKAAAATRKAAEGESTAASVDPGVAHLLK
jgi:hypothetical protein